MRVLPLPLLAAVCRERELLTELDDRIEACQAKIHFNEQQIMAIAPSKLQSASAPDATAVSRAESDAGADEFGNATFVSTVSTTSDGDSGSECAWHCSRLPSPPPFPVTHTASPRAVDDVSEVHNMNSLPEAKLYMKILFRMLVDLKRSERSQVGTYA